MRQAGTAITHRPDSSTDAGLTPQESLDSGERRLRFKSTERGVLLEIVRNEPSDEHSDCTIRAEVETKFGSFTGENSAVHFSGFDTFIKQLDDFLKTRQREVTLEMTEDCALTFFRWNAKGDVGLRFTLCRYTYVGDPLKSCPVVLRGEFPLEGEYLAQMPRELAQLVDL